MKARIFFFLIPAVIIVLAGCAPPETPFVSPFHPPEWILGKWVSDNDPDISWTFTSDNVLRGDTDDLLESAKAGNPVYTDISSISAYEITEYDSVAGVTFGYTFSKLSDTQFRLMVGSSLGGFVPPPEDFTKQ